MSLIPLLCLVAVAAATSPPYFPEFDSRIAKVVDALRGYAAPDNSCGFTNLFLSIFEAEAAELSRCLQNPKDFRVCKSAAGDVARSKMRAEGLTVGDYEQKTMVGTSKCAMRKVGVLGDFEAIMSRVRGDVLAKA